jgi:hypothetical protein
MLLSSFAHAKELEPLADFVRRNPLFMTQLRDSQMLVSRCSALYLVLSVRLNEMQYKKDGDDLIFHFTKTAENYETFSPYLNLISKKSNSLKRKNKKELVLWLARI